jgi:hypothetical protein
VQLTEESIQEHIEKACQKITNGDSAGAIAKAYTLVKGVSEAAPSKDWNPVQL